MEQNINTNASSHVDWKDQHQFGIDNSETGTGTVVVITWIEKCGTS